MDKVTEATNDDQEVSSALERFREQMRVQAEYYAENERLRAENETLRRHHNQNCSCGKFL